MSMILARKGIARLASLVLGAVLASGCAQSRDPATAVPTLQSAAEASTHAAPTPSALPSVCAVPTGEPDLQDATADPEWILAFLNAGGAVADLSDRLKAIGLAGVPEESTRVLDLNADGQDDVALALSGRPSTAWPTGWRATGWRPSTPS